MHRPLRGQRGRTERARRAPYIALLAACVLGYLLIGSGPARRSRKDAQSHAAPRAAAASAPHSRRSRPAPILQHAAADAHPASREQIASSVAALSADLLAEISAHPSKAAYDACIAARAECSSVEADVINYAIFRVRAVERIQAGEFGLQSAMDQHGAPDVRLALAGIVDSSKQPIERIGALLIEHHYGALAGSGQYAPLADRAYENLHLRPIPEAHLLSERHRSAPAPLAAAEEFAGLAYSGDPRARRAAFVALGHADTARQLNAAVVGLQPDSEHWFDAAMAASTCGIACADSLLHLTAASAEARASLYEALAFSPERDRSAMIELLLQHMPATEGGTEQALRNEFLRDALSERR